MAANNLVSYDLKGVKESFANWISNLSPSETPFTSMTGKEAIQNKYFQWQEDRLGSVAENAVTEGSDAGNAAQRATTVRQNVTQILRKVVSVSDTANALSSYGRGSELKYQMEKASKELKRDIEWALLNNGAAVDVAAPGTSNLNASVVGNGTPAYDLGKDIDGTTTLVGANLKPETNNASAPARARRTAGFTALVAAKGVASPEDANAIVHRDVATAGTLTEADVFSVTEGLYLAGACATIIMFHPTHAKFFSGMMDKVGGAYNRMRMFDGAVDTKVNTYVSTLVDPLGCTFKLIPNRFMPLDKIYFFDPSDWTQMVLRQPTTEQLAKLGSFDKYMIEVELGLRHRNSFASGVLEIGTKPTGAKVTAAGNVQYSKNGTSAWSATIPAASLKAGTAVDYFVRIDPASVVAADDGTYDYQFKLVADGTGTDGIGGLNLINDATEQNKAHITGTTPADQVGKKITIAADVIDGYGTKVSGTSLVGTWVA